MSDAVFSRALAKKPEELHPLVLAYIGDAVYELFIRQLVASGSNLRPNHLHRQSVRYVSAVAQSQALELVLPHLTETELEMVKKGRNTKSGTAPKHARIIDYRRSTAFECLVGYLFAKGQHERLRELLDIAVCGAGQ
ncbi:MAG TPA: ribonuclease III domain-containing protein [Bacilli bacterium]